MFALERSAPVSIVPVRSLSDRSTPLRFALESLASVSIVPVKSIPERLTLDRFAS